MQKYKSIYYADYPSDSPDKKNVTLAFGDKDLDLYETVRSLSSQELRELLSHPSYASLQSAADADDLALNTYCLRLLRSRVPAIAESFAQLSFADIPQEVRLPVAPIQVTYRGGQSEPLHAWYPFLEGYSPAFVEHVLREFAPGARRVLDPFAGSGTTPLSVARQGREAFYCEVNPLLQYVIKAKTLALRFSPKLRLQMVSTLKNLALGLDDFIQEASPDAGLVAAYASTFGSSQFFDPPVFERVLKLRRAIDRLAYTDEAAAILVTIAVLAQLLPASRLIRRGDIRYKTEKESQRGVSDLVSAIRKHIMMMARDLQQLGPVLSSPVLVCENARNLHLVPDLDLDAVITSPPYLNGTNYFRNAKIELWFLRCLNSNQDLSAYRYRAITAGINDVTVGKTNSNGCHAKVQAIVEELAANAYDPRIPRMVATYFSEMAAVFRGLRTHLRNDATVMVDIGDSSYGSIHVATDMLLVEVLKDEGLRLEQQVTLRRRMSRSGLPLKQTLLVFRSTSVHPVRPLPPAPGEAPAWSAAWAEFKTRLPHQQGDFAKRNWGHPLHSLCSYQGKMKPSLAAHLVRTFAPAGGALLDPFAGVGTIPFEAALNGVHSWSFDISPAALQIAQAKLGKPQLAVCAEVIDRLAGFITAGRLEDAELLSANEIRFNGVLPDYFEPATFREILLARRYFLENPPQSPSESLVFASLLHILHGNRPYALSRRSHPITPFAPTGPLEYKPLITHLQAKVNRSLAVELPATFVPGKVLFQDATVWWPHEVDQLDAIITSPPFFDSTRFYLANWLRLWFSGWSVEDFRLRPLAFVDEQQKSSFDIYEPIFRQARERLKPGGVFVMHLGKSAKCDMASRLSRLARQWFKIADIFDESVVHCESHGIRDKGAVTSHQYLVLH